MSTTTHAHSRLATTAHHSQIDCDTVQSNKAAEQELVNLQDLEETVAVHLAGCESFLLIDSG